MTRQVTVSETIQSLSFYDNTQQEIHLGNIQKNIFEGESFIGYDLLPDYHSNPFVKQTAIRNGKSYALGVGKGTVKAINPIEIQNLFMAMGYTTKDVFASNGGAQMNITMVDYSHEYQDTIQWDANFWHSVDGKLFRAVKLIFNLKIGSMVLTVLSGLWRKVCTNGLISPVLESPVLKFPHNRYEITKVQKQLETNTLALGDGIPTGKALASKNSLSKAYSLLAQYNDEIAEDKGLSEQFSNLREQFKIFRKEQMPVWLLGRFLNQVKLFIDNSQSDHVYGIDLLNAYTSAVNSYRQENPDKNDRGVYQSDVIHEHVINSVSSLAKMASIFSTDDKVIHSIPAKVGKPVKVIETVEIDEPEFVDYEDMEVTTDDYNNYLTNIA